jgi:hypothetical protein
MAKAVDSLPYLSRKFSDITYMLQQEVSKNLDIFSDGRDTTATLSADGPEGEPLRQPTGGFVMKLPMLVAVVLLSCAFEASAQDFDSDGVPDSIDNCLTSVNLQQLDPDLDGYGNPCDADFDQDGDTDQDDFDFYSFNCTAAKAFPICDLDEDGLIGTSFDLATFIGLFGSPPGPSGLACAGTVPCSAPPAVPGLGGIGMGGLLLALFASALAVRRHWMTA